MNIRRLTKYRALLLAAEAGALNAKATTPDDEARVIELIRQAEGIIEQKTVPCPLLDQMLSGEHESDRKSAEEIFPEIEFDCYSGIPSTCKVPGTFGNGWEGDEIAARCLARYRDAIHDLTHREAMHLLAHLVHWMYEHHANTGIGDTEPEYAIADAVSLYIFPQMGWEGISRGAWSKYLQVEAQTT
jgi:hypothetical protein